MSFRLRVALTFAALGAAIVTLLILASLRQSTTISVEQLHAQSTTSASLVGGAVADALLVYDFGTVATIVDQVANTPLVSRLAVFDAEGRQVAVSGPADDAKARGLNAMSKLLIGNSDLSAAGGMSVTYHIEIAGEKIGRVDLAPDLVTLNDRLAGLMYFQSLLAALGLVVAAISGWLASGALVRRIRQLDDAAARIAAGSFDHRVQVAGRDEIQRTAETVNRMADALVADRAALADSELALRSLLDNVGDGMYLVDPASGKVTEVNARAIERSGFGRDALIGRAFPSLVTADDPDAGATNPVMQHLAMRTRNTLTGSHIRADGSSYPVEASFAPIKIGDSPVVLVIASDLTDRLLVERRLQQAQRMEAIGNLTGGVAHDFNNLLAVILGCTELLRMDPAHDAELVDTIKKSTEQGRDLTYRLLAYARQQPLAPRSVDLAELVGNVRDLLARTLGETIEINSVFDPDLWNANADPGQVEDALLNLAINARDAMPAGGTLAIRCENIALDDVYCQQVPDAAPGSYVRIGVSDTGSGMSEDLIARAFEPFFTTKGVGKGSGLGLSMIYGFAKQSGGHVTIQSRPGQGTTVSIFLPRDVSAAADGRVQQDQAKPMGRGETVLIIEDNVNLGRLLVRQLDQLGYNSLVAETARAARELIDAGEEFGAILSDVVLPGGTSGPAFVNEIRSQDKSIKAIFMSGYAAESLGENVSLASGEVLLNKPFTKSELARAIRDLF